jgi:DNA (cytosine-5)-methyltransferase 1
VKILNLYAGIGGNRKLWGDEHEITAVENVPHVAEVYRHFFPQDTVIEEDAHQYLLDHYQEFDFIWSSPPCPTHSRQRRANLLDPYKDNSAQLAHGGGHLPAYPDMKLYQEIIFLKHHFRGRWTVENVEPYYKPLISPRLVLDRHCIWANFAIPFIPSTRTHGVMDHDLTKHQEYFGLTLPTWAKDKVKLLRNVADPYMGQHILKAALKETKQETLL